MVKMRLVPACYTSGRGASNLFGPGHCTIIGKHIRAHFQCIIISVEFLTLVTYIKNKLTYPGIRQTVVS